MAAVGGGLMTLALAHAVDWVVWLLYVALALVVAALVSQELTERRRALRGHRPAASSTVAQSLPYRLLISRPVRSLVIAGWLIGVALAVIAVARQPNPAVLRVALHDAQGRASGQAVVTTNGKRRIITLEITKRLAILRHRSQYELWFCASNDTPAHPDRVSAGTLTPAWDGHTTGRLTVGVDAKRYPNLAITAEPADGDPRPNGPDLLQSRRR